MNRLLSMFLALCLLLSLIPITASASEVEASGECSGMNSSVFWSLTSDGTLTISGVGEMREYKKGYMLPPWCSRHDIHTVIVEEGITQISSVAFYGLKNATTFSLPNSLVSIGRDGFYSYVFQRCENLETITLPDNLMHLGANAFQECFSLKSIRIPDGIVSIESEVFSSCHALEEVTLPANLENIYYGAFNGAALKEISFPETLKSIGNYAFAHCRFAELVIPSSVTQIGSYAFFDCQNLTSVQLPENLTSIQPSTFLGCIALKSIDLPDTLSSIGDYAFQFCSSLENLTIPPSVTSLGSCVFWNCDSLNELTFTGNAPEFAPDTFKYYSGIIRYPGNDSTWTSELMQNCGGNVTWVAHTHEHNWETQIVEPTCTEQGYTTYYCSSCGDSYVDSYKDATGHIFGEWVETKEPPSCTERGEESRSCVCGETETRKTHTLEHEYDDNDICANCGHNKNHVPMYRLYNPYTHEHLLTSNPDEMDQLVKVGWSLDGIAWNAPASGLFVYRLYNPFDDWHTYTLSQEEIDILVPLGWKVDGVVCYSATEADVVPIYRLFNPYEKTNYHLLTANPEERDLLEKAGWIVEGIAWNAVK